MEQFKLLQNFFNKEKGGKKISWLFYLGLAGISLIFLSSFLPQQKAADKVQTTANQQTENEYITQLEKKLTSILQKTYGVGNVEVMITLESSSSIIYAQNEQSDTQTDNGKEKEILQQKNVYKSEHVIIENSGDKAPLVETSIAPEVKGVAIVCSGGGDILVVKNVTDLVSALLALPTNRICVTKMT